MTFLNFWPFFSGRGWYPIIFISQNPQHRPGWIFYIWFKSVWTTRKTKWDVDQMWPIYFIAVSLPPAVKKQVNFTELSYFTSKKVKKLSKVNLFIVLCWKYITHNDKYHFNCYNYHYLYNFDNYWTFTFDCLFLLIDNRLKMTKIRHARIAVSREPFNGFAKTFQH